MRLIFGLTHKTYLFHSVSSGGPHDKRWPFYVYKYMYVSCISLSDFSRSETFIVLRRRRQRERRLGKKKEEKRSWFRRGETEISPTTAAATPRDLLILLKANPLLLNAPRFLSLLICKTQQKKEERFVLSFIIFGFPFMGFRLISRLFGVMVG